MSLLHACSNVHVLSDGIHGYSWQAKTDRQIDLALTRRYERMGARFRQQPQNYSLLFEWCFRPPDESDISFHNEVTADIEIQDGLACLVSIRS